MELAAKLVKRLAAEHLRVLNDGYARKNSDSAPEGDKVQRMIGKIEKWGPLSRRALYRYYSRQHGALLDPVPADAVKIGRVRQEGNLLSVIPPVVSPNVSDEASASVCQPCQPA